MQCQIIYHTLKPSLSDEVACLPTITFVKHPKHCYHFHRRFYSNIDKYERCADIPIQSLGNSDEVCSSICRQDFDIILRILDMLSFQSHWLQKTVSKATGSSAPKKCEYQKFV